MPAPAAPVHRIDNWLAVTTVDPKDQKAQWLFLQHRFFIPLQPTLIILLLTHRTHCAVLKMPLKINLKPYKDEIISWVSKKHTIPGILSRIIGIGILLNPSDQKA
jgi:hypothetical protein